MSLQITATAIIREQPSHGHGAQGQTAPQCSSQQQHPTIITSNELEGFFSITSVENALTLLPGGGILIQGGLQSFLYLFPLSLYKCFQCFQIKEAPETMKETAASFASLASKAHRG